MPLNAESKDAEVICWKLLKGRFKKIVFSLTFSMEAHKLVQSDKNTLVLACHLIPDLPSNGICLSVCPIDLFLQKFRVFLRMSTKPVIFFWVLRQTSKNYWAFFWLELQFLEICSKVCEEEKSRSLPGILFTLLSTKPFATKNNGVSLENG